MPSLTVGTGRALLPSRPPLTLSLVGFNSAVPTDSDPDIPLHANAAVGDLAISCIHLGVTTGSIGVPPGWLELFRGGPGAAQALIGAVKVLTGGDSITFTSNSGNHDGNSMVFRPSRPITSIMVLPAATWNVEATASNPAAQAVLAAAAPCPLLVVGFASCAGGTVLFSTATPAFDATNGSSQSDSIIGYKYYEKAPQDHSIDMDDEGNFNGLASGLISVFG